MHKDFTKVRWKIIHISCLFFLYNADWYEVDKGMEKMEVTGARIAYGFFDGIEVYGK